MKVKFWMLLAILIVVHETTQAQCEGELSKKEQKLWDSSSDRRSTRNDRILILKELLESNPEYAPAMFRIAELQITNAQKRGGSFKSARSTLEQAVETCPDGDFNAYYYLGEIYLGKSDYQRAVGYYKDYIKYSKDAETFTPKDDERFATVESNLHYAEFFAESFKNPKEFNASKVIKVSTDADEYLPLISPDNESLYFTRRKKVTGMPNPSAVASTVPRFTEKLSVAGLAGTVFTEGEPMPAPFNVDEKEKYGGVTMSINNKEMILTVCKQSALESGRPYMNCDLYSSKYEYSENPENEQVEWHWTPIKNLGPNVNTADGWESQPSLSGDGTKLFFATARKGTKGTDIFYTERLRGGPWGPAKSLGNVINTEGNDKTPFIHTDSRSLYFASQGHYNFGGFDMFYSKMNDDGSWSKPVNLGHPINTKEDEHGFVISTDGQKVYYGSGRKFGPDGGLEIYSFHLYEEAQPEKLVFVKGKVKNTGADLKNAKVEIKNPGTNEKATFDVNENDGTYAAVMRVTTQKAVVVNIKAEGKSFESKVVKVRETPFQEVNTEVKDIRAGESYTIPDIVYKTNSAEIEESSKVMLNEFIDYLKDHPEMKIAIHGHTDNVGAKAANLALSTDRAFSVKEYVQSKGISGKRIAFKGFGDSKPIASNSTAEGRSENRRTEFLVVDF